MATRLEQYQQQYQQLKTELAEIGFICQGSVLERYTSLSLIHISEPTRPY